MKSLNSIRVIIISILAVILSQNSYAISKYNNSLFQIKDLSTIFDKGYIFQDTNGDSVVDFLNVKIIVPEKHSKSHIVCAANIAARLAYETSAMNLDIVQTGSVPPYRTNTPVICIGVPIKSFLGMNLIDPSLIDISSLAPGQGRIQFISQKICPEYGLISIRGADDTGLITAANYLAGRYPDLWKVKGKRFSDVRKRFYEFLTQRKLTPDGISIDYVNVDANNPGISRLFLTIRYRNTDKMLDAIRSFREDDKYSNDEKTLKISDLEFDGIRETAINIVSPDTSQITYLKPKNPWNIKVAKAHSPSPSLSFPLWQFYTINGIFRDTNKDRLPDEIPAYLSIGEDDNHQNGVNIAARIGLESAGIRIPMARVAGKESQADKFGFAILFGRNHYLINRLKKDKKLIWFSDCSNEGFIQFVSQSFNKKNGIVISANTQEGLDAISEYVSKRLPYLWNHGKGNPHLREIERDVRDFFQIRKAPGQVACGIYKLKEWLNRIKKEKIDSIYVELAARKILVGLDSYIKDVAAGFFKKAAIDVKTYPTGFGTGKKIFDEEFEIPWEVNEFWNYFYDKILPNITHQSHGKIEVILSESPEIRKRIKDRIKKELSKKNVPEGSIEVNVLCAYKQGYSWLHDYVLPKIVDKPVGQIKITYYNLRDSKEVKWQTIKSNIRWLQDIYPIDEVMAKKLNIPDSLITFHPTFKKGPIYRVRVVNKKGEIIFKDSFSPKYVIRPLLNLFPQYESVRVTTGWVSAEIDGKILIDKRIKTDIEKFWDHLQNVTYKRFIDYLMNIQEGRLSTNNAPYFDRFTLQLTLSEPDYPIGIDREIISSTEALHEDIYFETLTLLHVVGSFYGVGSLRLPGSILPYIKSSEMGPGKVKIELIGKERARPELVLLYKEKKGEWTKRVYSLDNLKIQNPKLTGIWVRPGEERISRLMFEVTATDSIDRYEEYKMRASENHIDQTFISIGKLTGMVNILKDLHDSGLFEDRLSYDRVGQILFKIILEDSSEFYHLAALPQSKNPKNTDNPTLIDENYKYSGERIIQWDRPMSPHDVEKKLSMLNTFPEINVYYMATSLLGNNVYAVDILPPVKSRYLSQAKLNALRPTLLLTGRVHGNEVSSTSHILRLAELCATDPVYKNYLKKVNLVLYPIANPDGAQTAYEMYLLNKDHMLHAGRFGALSADIRAGNTGNSKMYPEAGIITRLKETWLPDIYVDLHGIPSHEWVQYFAGYSGWVNNRYTNQRSYWLPRGWYIPYFTWIENKKYPELKKVSFAILDSIAASITSFPELMRLNDRLYKRYRKYQIQDDENFREHFHKGILVYSSLKGRKSGGSGTSSPLVTYFSIITEAPDETATGEWMNLVCKAGLAHTSALLRYLANGINRLEHRAKEYRDSISRWIFRKKPVLPSGGKLMSE